VVIAQIELLLSYAKRFYKRQFLTRQSASNDLLQEFEKLLKIYFKEEGPVNNSLPTLQYLAEQSNDTPNYLSDMLRSLT
jgi:AraC family transcriptional activator of pobA